MLKGLLATGAACALAGGVAVAGHAAQAPSAPASTVALTTASSTTGTQAAAEADAVAGTTAGKLTERRRCERLPQRIARTEKLEKVLAGDASTKGSIAYLQARIDKARAAHEDTLVATLEKRLEFRKALQGFLPQRLDLLKTASTTICAPAAASAAS